MKSTTRPFQLLSDETRIRILMLLMGRELCVCQIMGVLGIPQPLVSRNLTLLSDAGLLCERREGTLMFYAVRRDLPASSRQATAILKHELNGDRTIREDLQSLADCHGFQKVTGKCDMETFLEFMKKKKGKRQNVSVLRNIHQRRLIGGTNEK
jgi:ArsR family transcriptional regulator